MGRRRSSGRGGRTQGPVVFNGPGRTYFGSLTGDAAAPGLAETVESFNKAGLPCELVEDVRSAEWSKAANAAAGFATALLSRAPLQETTTNPAPGGGLRRRSCTRWRRSRRRRV